MKFKGLAVVPLLLVLPLAASASELAINPGLWKTTMTRTNPLTGEPTTETSTQCVKQKSFKPSDMMKNAQGCELVKDELDGDTLNFRMECNIQGQTSTVDGMFQTDGKTGKGNMNVKMNMGQMNMNMKMNWTSERVGGC
ncbi:MAG: DUF3617 family protein [Arenicellales bacterium]|jgi:hypothetical protein